MPGIPYSVIGILAIVIHCIVNRDTLFSKNYKDMEKPTRCYLVFLWGILLFYVTDVLWGFLADIELIQILRIDTFFYFISMSLAVVWWTDYVVAYLHQESGFGKVVHYFGRFFVLFEAIALLVNIQYPIFFSFDEDGTYHAGILRYVALYIQIALFLASTTQTLYVAMRSKGVKRRRHLSISVFAVSMAVAIVLQMYLPLLPVYSIGYLLGSCFLRIYVREDEKEEEYRKLQREVEIVSSLAGIYYCSYYADLETKTFVEIDNKIAENDEFIGEKGNVVEALDKLCKDLVLPEYKKEMQEFVDLSTLDERLTKKKYYISIQFESVHLGWAEGMFVAGDRDEQGKLKHIIWVIRTINDEKEKEEKLLYNSYIDEMTGLYNRKMYAEDIDTGSDSNLNDGARAVDVKRDDFVFISMDVNGLKVINDSKGHAAGDELLVAAAQCMRECLGPYGRVYRTGGDEFIALLNVSKEKLEQILEEFEEATEGYKGKYVDSVSVSYGYVVKQEHPELSMLEIEKQADTNMYLAKRLHYSTKGGDRRGQQQNAYKALCAIYTKILMINLTEGAYSIISMDEEEQTAVKGFSDNIFEWLEKFATSGQVHPDDREAYLAKTNKAFLTDYFRHAKKSLSIIYRRKTTNEYKRAEMEIIPAESYSDDNQNLFLYVKNIDE